MTVLPRTALRALRSARTAAVWTLTSRARRRGMPSVPASNGVFGRSGMPAEL